MSVAESLVLLDWTARQLADVKPGPRPHDTPPIFARLSIDPRVWGKHVSGFGRSFWNASRWPQTIDAI